MSKNLSFNVSSVPRDWLIIPCGVFFKEKSIKNTEGEMNLSVYRDYGVIPKDSRDDNHNRVSEDTSNYKLVEPGDFVLNKMKGWSGSLGVSDYRGIVSPSYTVLEPVREIHNKYFHYLLRSETYRQMYESLSYGVRIGQWELRYHDFKKIPSLYPPIDEQKLISRYLDKKTNQIDSLVEKIHKKIELLKEQRTSLINHYVTKGLDPNVEMKDSGIEWIGDIPKHWKIVSTKRLFKTYFGGSWGDEPEENQVDNIVKVVRVTEFDMNYLEVRKEIPTLRSLELSKDSPKLLQNGDHILEKSGGGEKTPVGRVVLYHNPNDERVVNSNFTNVCRPNMELVDPYFSIFLLSSLYSGGATVRNIKQTTGIQNLDLDGFMSEKVSIPPLQEQKELSSRIRNSNNSIQNLIQRNLDKINILIEYRQSLISSVVNGKFRVKEDMI